MMRDLLRKDWRVYRAAVIGGAVLAAGPYLVMLAASMLFAPAGNRNAGQHFVDALGAACSVGLGLTFLMAAVFGGVAFAAERRDRTAEFLAMLPVRRGRIVLSKLLVALAFLGAVAAVHAAVGGALTIRDVRLRELPAGFMFREALLGCAYAACAFVLFFGLAWALSLYLSSPAIAASVTIGLSVILLFVTLTWAGEAADAHRDVLGGQLANHLPYIVMSAVSLVVGGAAFVGSTAHYVGRVNP